ncbi:MAG: vWA domain-containing protein, partial [Isosphaeraceae bacterium]
MDRLLRLLADRIGVKPPQAGEAIVPQLQFEQPWSQGLALLVALGCGALIFWLYRREDSAPGWYRMLLASLRFTLVLLAMFMLSEAVLSVERTGLPSFVIMADDSASGGVVDQYADPKLKQAAEGLAKLAGKTEASRLAVAQGWLARDDGALLRTLQEQHKVRLYLVSTAARPLAEVDTPEQVKPALDRLLNVEPTGAQTRLGDGVRQVLTELRGAPPTAILLLTDGQTTDGEALASAAELARRKGVPLYTIGLGDPEPARDLELTDLLVDEVVFVDDLVRFEAKLLARGFQGQEVSISLKQLPIGSNDPKLANEIDSAKVLAPPDGQPLRVELRHRPKETGPLTFIMEVEPRPRELQTDNNRIVRVVNVRQEKLKVLLVDGGPRYEYRYVKNLLERDPTIDLRVVLQSADPEYSEQDQYALPTFPTAKEGSEGLFQYDVVLFGDVD